MVALVEREVMDSAWCCLGPGRGFRKVRAESLADTRPIGVALHVDKIQVGRHQRLERAVGRQGLDGTTPATEAITGARPSDACAGPRSGG